MLQPISSLFCPKLGLYLVILQSVHVLQSVQVYPAVFLTYFISAAVNVRASLALMVPFSLPYKRAGCASVLYNFILVFCSLNMLLIIPVFSSIYSICCHCPIIFIRYKIS
jgi:hypothetical protein